MFSKLIQWMVGALGLPPTAMWRVLVTVICFGFVYHIAGVSGGLPWVDSFVTRAEARELISELMAEELEQINDKIDKNALYDKCAGLRQEIRILRNAIFEAEQHNDNDNAAHINRLKLDLKELEQTYESLDCPKVLA